LGASDPAAPPQPTAVLDQLTTEAPLHCPSIRRRLIGISTIRSGADRNVRGTPGLWWSINGHLYPNVPMYVVREGDIVIMHRQPQRRYIHASAWASRRGAFPQ
jgi:hypothetical protein